MRSMNVAPAQRGGGSQVEVVADQHRGARDPRRVEATAAVREDDGAAPRGRGGADAVDHRLDAAPLVEVAAAEEHQGPGAAGAHAPHPSRVALDRRWEEARQVGDGELGDGLAQQVRCRDPAGPEHERDVVPRAAGALGEHLGGVRRSGPRVVVQVGAHAPTLAGPGAGRWPYPPVRGPIT